MASLALRAIHLQVARPSESEEKAGRKTAPAGACGEQPPKAALGERRNAGGNLKISTIKQTSTQGETQVEVFMF